MAFWLRRDAPTIASLDGVIRRDDWLQVAELDAAFLAVEELRASVMVEAEANAHALLAEAHAQAQQTIDNADTQADAIFEDARLQGYQSGVEQWAATSLHGMRQADDQLRGEKARMAKIVVAALEKIIPLQDPQGIYKQVIRVLSKSIQAVRYVSVRVCPEDVASAQAAFNEMSQGSVFAKLIEVIGDDSVLRGACLVESDQGIIDLSLNSQLDALRVAISASFGDSVGGNKPKKVATENE